MKKLLSIIVTIAMMLSVFGFTDGLDDQTVLYKDIRAMYRANHGEWKYTTKAKAQRMFDRMIREGADPNKTVKENEKH